MGYKARRTYVLEFEDRDGMEVRARSVPFGQFMKLSELSNMSGGAGFTPEDEAKLEGLLAGFAEALVDWNLEEDDGREIPATLDGLRSLDIDLVMTIIGAWMDVISSVSPGKDATSPNGLPSVEASIPMDVLSPSPSS